MASTYAGVNPIKKAQRYSKAEKKRVEITQPNVVAEYHYGMGGVDRFDQNIAAYMITQRSKKWWWSVFRFCNDMVVQNAYQIYRLQARGLSKKLDCLGFRRAIIEVYSKKYTKDSSGLFKHPQMCQSNEVRHDNVGHWIKKAMQRRCQISLARARHNIVAKNAQLHSIQNASKHFTHVRQYKHRVIYMISEVTYMQEHNVCV